MPENDKFYELSGTTRLSPGLRLTIEKAVTCFTWKTDISDLVPLPSSVLEQRRADSERIERAVYEQALAVVAKWDEQAALTQMLNMALEYQKAPVCEHSSNQWGKNGVGHNSISNMTYKMIWHIDERTRYDREAGKSVPVAWEVTWNVYTNPPAINGRGSLIRKVAGQSGKVFKDKAAAEKYMNGRVAAYAHLFAELSPPVPPEYCCFVPLTFLYIRRYQFSIHQY